MKAVKLSLAAALVASSAFAVENVKVDGQLKLWYQTADVDGSKYNMFDKSASAGDFVAKVGVKGDLTKKVGFGVTVHGVSTLGLENNLVGGVNTAVDPGLVGTNANPVLMSEAYFTYSAGKTIAKIGRQELNTPLAYSEQWQAVANSFEAAVLINKDLPDTTIVAAYVGKGNGSAAGTTSTFTTFGAPADKYNLGTLNNTDSGAYALGMVNKSVPNLTLHPVYYDVIDIAKAFWVDATYVVPNIATVEAMYANMDPVAKKGKSTDGYAAKVSGAVSGINLAASYSNIGKGDLNIGNVATNFATTKVYTAGVGGSTTGQHAGSTDTTGYKLEASTKVADVTLGAYYNAISFGKDTNQAAFADKDISSVAVTAAVKVDEVNLMAAYISESNDKAAADQQIVRVIASINF